MHIHATVYIYTRNSDKVKSICRNSSCDQTWLPHRLPKKVWKNKGFDDKVTTFSRGGRDGNPKKVRKNKGFDDKFTTSEVTTSETVFYIIIFYIKISISKNIF